MEGPNRESPNWRQPSPMIGVKGNIPTGSKPYPQEAVNKNKAPPLKESLL